MNKEQLKYLGSGLIFSDVYYTSMGVTLLNSASLVFNLIQGNVVSSGLFLVNLIPFAGYTFIQSVLRKSDLKGDDKIGLKYLTKIKSDVDNFPLQHVDEVIISDSFGLEAMLKRTSDKEKKEWGVPFFSELKDGNAEISRIHNPYSDEYVIFSNFMSLGLNFDKLFEDEYNGFQHFHPISGVSSYYICRQDRVKPKLEINLLSFNVKEKPVVIGFNRLHTYVPLDGDQTKLQKASFKDIYRFLG